MEDAAVVVLGTATAWTKTCLRWELKLLGPPFTRHFCIARTHLGELNYELLLDGDRGTRASPHRDWCHRTLSASKATSHHALLCLPSDWNLMTMT